jgi:hypothetical protein
MNLSMLEKSGQIIFTMGRWHGRLNWLYQSESSPDPVDTLYRCSGFFGQSTVN